MIQNPLNLIWKVSVAAYTPHTLPRELLLGSTRLEHTERQKSWEVLYYFPVEKCLRRKQKHINHFS